MYIVNYMSLLQKFDIWQNAVISKNRLRCESMSTFLFSLYLSLKTNIFQELLNSNLVTNFQDLD